MSRRAASCNVMKIARLATPAAKARAHRPVAQANIPQYDSRRMPRAVLGGAW
jgi:hypothetical protein